MEENENSQAINRLLTIMTELRAKCPWDKKQTIESLRCLTIEEVYELSDAIMDKNLKGISEELGDIMLHIVFYCQIAMEQNSFNFAEVVNHLCEKLIIRHPHVYATEQVNSAEDVKVNWEKIKLSSKEGRKTVLGGVPKSLPALVKAYRIQEKVHGVHFDWKESEDVLAKIRKEIKEFETEKQANDHDKMEEEFGDILFSLINYGRHLHINPEDALEKTNRKFINRFNRMEQNILADGKHLPDMSVEEMEKYWQIAKKDEK